MNIAKICFWLAVAIAISFRLFTSPPADAQLEGSESLRDWYNAGGFFNHQGHAIFFRHTLHPNSTLPILLLVHGFPTSSFDWHQTWPHLSPHFQLLALDLLGFGFSDKPWPHNYTILEQVSIIDSILAHLGISRVHLFVHDYAVSIAQEMLARKKEGGLGYDVLSVAFLNGGLFPGHHHPLLSQKILANNLIGPWLARLVPRLIFARGIRSVFGPHLPPSEELVKDYYLLNTHKHGLYVLSDVLQYLEERREKEERWSGALVWAHELKMEGEGGRVEVPCYFINGPADPVSGREMWEHYMSSLPRAQGLSLHDSVGHFPLIQDVTGTVNAFFKFQSQIPQN